MKYLECFGCGPQFTNDIKYHPGGPVPNELFSHKQYKYTVQNTIQCRLWFIFRAFSIHISSLTTYTFAGVYFHAIFFPRCYCVEAVGKMLRL